MMRDENGARAKLHHWRRALVSKHLTGSGLYACAAFDPQNVNAQMP